MRLPRFVVPTLPVFGTSLSPPPPPGPRCANLCLTSFLGAPTTCPAGMPCLRHITASAVGGTTTPANLRRGLTPCTPDWAAWVQLGGGTLPRHRRPTSAWPRATAPSQPRNRESTGLNRPRHARSRLHGTRSRWFLGVANRATSTFPRRPHAPKGAQITFPSDEFTGICGGWPAFDGFAGRCRLRASSAQFGRAARGVMPLSVDNAAESLFAPGPCQNVRRVADAHVGMVHPWAHNTCPNARAHTRHAVRAVADDSPSGISRALGRLRARSR